jgi:hypothetical protein
VKQVTQLSCRADFQNEWSFKPVHLYALSVCKGAPSSLLYFYLLYVNENTNCCAGLFLQHYVLKILA